MKGKAVVAGIAGLASLAVASSALADAFDSKLQAAVFNTKLVQAEDECVGSGTTTIGGVDACAPSNTTTGAGEQFSVGKLLVKSKAGTSQVLAILKSSGNGDNPKQLAGKNLRVRLVLRITKRQTTAAPTDAVTWVDQTLNCASPGVIGSNGNFLFKNQLAGALGCNLDTDLVNDAYQKEIVSAAIVDVGTGFPVAVPGVRKKP